MSILLIIFFLIFASALLYKIGDLSELETLHEAEWLIRDYCNTYKTCEDCKRWDKEKQTCKYKTFMPGKWNFEDSMIFLKKKGVDK